MLDASRHVLSSKSSALKVTGLAFLSVVPIRFFYSLMNEFETTLNILATTPGRSLKSMLFETGRGVWSLPPSVPISQAAARVLATSRFVLHAAEVAPAEIPQCLWRFLPHETQMLVASTQGIDHVPEDAGLDRVDEEEDKKIVKAMQIKMQQAQAPPPAPAPAPAPRAPAPAPRAPAPAPRATGGYEGLPPRPPPPAPHSVGNHSAHYAGTTAREPSHPQPHAQAGTSGPTNPNSSGSGVPLDSLLSAGIAVGLAAYSTQQQTRQQSPAINGSLPLGAGALLKEEPAKVAQHQGYYQDPNAAAQYHAPSIPQGGSMKRARSEDEEDDVALFNATKQQRAGTGVEGGGGAGAGRSKPPASAAYSGDADDVQLYPLAGPPSMPAGNVPLVHPNLAASSFGIEDVRELNQLLDVMFLERNSMGAGGTTLMKNMAEAAANISMIIYLMTYRLPAVATVGMDEKLSALKTRAYLVYNGVVNSEPMDLLLPFSELLSAESGMIRRTLESQSRAAGVPATAAGVLNPYDGGEGLNYNVW